MKGSPRQNPGDPFVGPTDTLSVYRVRTIPVAAKEFGIAREAFIDAWIHAFAGLTGRGLLRARVISCRRKLHDCLVVRGEPVDSVGQ